MHRREAIGLIALAPWLPAIQPPDAAPGRSAHAIDALELFRLKVNQRGDWVLLRTRTAGGLSGLGDASHSGDDARTMALARDYLAALRGRSIFEVERLRQFRQAEVDTHGRPAAVALSAIEQSLWDLQGQALGVPCYQLFGGLLRPRVRQYANINRMTTDRTPAGFARSAEQAAAAGFDAVKMAPFDGMPKGQGAARSAHIALIEALAALRLYWLEEVTPPASLAAIDRAAPMTTAGGEGLYGLDAFYRYAAAGNADVLMPDVKWCGGMLELRKVAALAEAMGLRVSPHGPASPVGNAAVAHLCAALPNIEINEFAFGEAPWRAELIDPPEAFDAGHLTPSARPGFGVRLNDDLVRRLAQ